MLPVPFVAWGFIFFNRKYEWQWIIKEEEFVKMGVIGIGGGYMRGILNDYKVQPSVQTL